MSDVVSKAVRSHIMSRIRGTANERTELALLRVFRVSRIRGWRRNARIKLCPPNTPVLLKLIRAHRFRPWVRPDFVFPRRLVAVFVDGCFWHGCPRCYRRPGSNRRFWDKKIICNRKRDRFQSESLRRSGWRVLRIWEHELRKPERVVVRVKDMLRHESPGMSRG